MTQMKFLCIDTATQMESVALVDGQSVIATTSAERPKGHGGDILDDIHNLLVSVGWGLADLDAVGIGLGPGSFTGLRVGLATAKGLALALNRPIFGVRTTRLLLGAYREPALAVLDARRGQVYIEGAGLERPICCRPEDVIGHIQLRKPTCLLGDGARRYGDIFRGLTPLLHLPADEELHYPKAALIPACCIGQSAADLTTLEPVYVRPSDAELNYPDGFPDAVKQPPKKP